MENIVYYNLTHINIYVTKSKQTTDNTKYMLHNWNKFLKIKITEDSECNCYKLL